MNETLAILKYASIGGFLGLSAGISPGPLLTLVISETLKQNRREGIKIAISPLFTDIPIVLASIFVFSGLAGYGLALGIVSVLGGIFIAYLGFETLLTKELVIGQPVLFTDSFKKGITANLLNPHPYLFWITVGVPMAIKAYHTELLAVIAYFTFFYSSLIGSKILIAHIVSKTKIFFSNILYLWIMRLLGISLFIFSGYFFYEGIKYLLNSL